MQHLIKVVFSYIYELWVTIKVSLSVSAAPPCLQSQRHVGQVLEEVP